MTNDTNLSDYADTYKVIPTEHTALRIKSGMLSSSEVDPLGPDAEFSVNIVHDGAGIAISAGAHQSQLDDGNEFYSFHDITPQQAREFADALHDVADAAEEAATVEEAEPESFLRRILG